MSKIAIKKVTHENRNESAALHQARRTGQGRLFSAHGQNIRQGKGQFHRAIRVQVQNRCAVVERHRPTLHRQKQGGDNGKQGD